MNFYNEFDPSAAAWLRGLIATGLIPDGVVDERSITDIQPDELSPFTQCHFFAGIGGWSLALELAGWPADAQTSRAAGSGACAVASGRSVLERMGWAPERASELASRFRTHSVAQLEALWPHHRDEKALVSMARKGRQQLEELFAQEREEARARRRQQGWDAQSGSDEGASDAAPIERA